MSTNHEQQQRRMWLRVPEQRARVYQVIPGSLIWYADVRTALGTYDCRIAYNRDDAFRRAHELAAKKEGQQ